MKLFGVFGVAVVPSKLCFVHKNVLLNEDYEF